MIDKITQIDYGTLGQVSHALGRLKISVYSPSFINEVVQLHMSMQFFHVVIREVMSNSACLASNKGFPSSSDAFLASFIREGT